MKRLNESKSYNLIYNISQVNRISRLLLIILIVFILILFLPWTQNIRAKGTVSTLRQESRAQNLNSVIPGRIKKWYVKEGDVVKAGDTILEISEIKEDYLDPELLTRTQEQLQAKEFSVEFYQGKRDAQKDQIQNLQNSLSIKSNQLQNKLGQQKLKIESLDAAVKAAKNDLQIAKKQIDRQQELYDKGLVSLTQLEERNLKYQNAQAKLISAENNLDNAKQELLVIQLDINANQQEYMEKINKAQGEMMQAMSQISTSQGDASKIKNQYSNYKIRNNLYFLIAPQDGQIVQAKRSGIGEIIKDGETIVQIVPLQHDKAVELFIRPLDVPLLEKNQKIRFVFDGFPAIVFSGWPNTSYGTFGGVVTMVENNVNKDGYYRVLVSEDSTYKKWPPQLRLGTGAQAIALLKEVPIWYELWRNINGFPPDYYKKDKN